jgi:hypothetical protein
MWPFRRKSRPAAPPVDFDTPVTNPRLVAAISAFAATQGPPQVDALLLELQRAVFLVVTFMENARISQSQTDGKVTISKNSLIGILEVEDADGGRCLPLFSDWDAIRKFTNDSVSTLVMPAAQAWPFVAQNYGAAVVNPGGVALPLNCEQVDELACIALSAGDPPIK